MNKTFGLLVGATLAIALNPINPASAATIKLDGKSYEVKTITGKFNDLKDKLQKQPWWNSSNTAKEAATMVKGELGKPNDVGGGEKNAGPAFAYGTGGTSGDRTIQTFLFAPDLPNANSDGVIGVNFSPTRFNGTWAVVVPEPLTLLGTITAGTMFTAFKLKANKAKK